MTWWVTSPREAAWHMLADRVAVRPLVTSVPLVDFQKQGAERAAAILEQRNGVLIADSVGLGKTYVALALIEDRLRSEDIVLVVIPAALRSMWRKELRRLPLGENVTLLSHTALARGRTPTCQPDLIVVDEAHAFRNPRTRRYRALRRLCGACKLVLLTATPVNNSLADLYFQLRLWCADGAFSDLGIGSLRALLLDETETWHRDLERLRRAVMVRRTRAQARTGGTTSSFPRRLEAVPVSFELPLSVSLLGDLLSELRFSAYTCDFAISPSLLQFSLLKRMESSAWAIRTTLKKQVRFHEQFLCALDHGRLLRSGDFRALFSLDDQSMQLAFDDIALDEAHATAPSLTRDVESDLRVLQRWLGALAERDDKLLSLVALLHGRPSGTKTLIFTEYRDTARYLWRSLRKRFATGLVDGAGAWLGETPASRNDVVERFAPVANGARPHVRESLSVLVATDVLAEGMNLQDADAVVSYDLPWNPVKLIQRAGRVDRIGSAHDVVTVYNFIPDREFDAFLGLAQTIRGKLELVRATIGLERPVLDANEPFDEVVRAIAAGDAAVLDRIEGGNSSLADEYAAPPGIPVASLSENPRHVLVGLRSGMERRLVLVDLMSGELLESGVEGLLAAARENEDRRMPPMIALERAKVVAQEQRAASKVLRLGAQSPAGMVAKMLRARLAELTIDVDASLYDWADSVLSTLDSVSSLSAEDALVEIFEQRFETVSHLLRGIQSALSDNSQRPIDDPAWELTGVIAAD